MGSPRAKILLDTNMLLSVFKFRVDLESELEGIFGTFTIGVPSIVKEELLRMHSSEARTALNYIQAKGIEVDSGLEEKNVNVDVVLISMAKKYDFFLATNDKILRKIAKKNNIKTIFLRQRRALVVD